MPRRKNQKRGYKSAAVRELLTQNPDMPVKDIVAALGQKGIAVKPNMVYLLKSKMKARKRRQQRKNAVATGDRAGVANPVELVRKVKDLAALAGGLHNLKQLVDVLAE